MRFHPLIARTDTFRAELEPVSHDWVKVVFVRDGAAHLVGDLGALAVQAGHVLFLGANMSCGGTPAGHITVTTVYMDTDYATDLVFWQHAGHFADRFDAARIVASTCAEPWRSVRLRDGISDPLGAALDRLVSLSTTGDFSGNYYQMLGLWFSIVHQIAPAISQTPAWLISRGPPAHTFPAIPRIRRFAPLRSEVRQAADLIAQDVSRSWTLHALAREVHMSPAQLARMFVGAYGKTPRAYQAVLRAQELARLLRETDLPIAAAMRQVGWKSRGHAARLFRHYAGLSPTAYRKAHESSP